MANLVRTLATVRTQRPYFITPGCVGNWRFDEGTGTLVRDSSGYRDNGTIHGATWTTGKFGKALQFDGVDDYVNCGNSQSLNITDKITIEAWVNPSADGWKYKRPITLSPATSQDNYQVKVELTPSNFDYSKAKANGEDLRFYQADGTSLDYWIETWNTSGTSTIWVEVATSGTDTIYMYYGNPSASNTENGDEVFEFFDDFNESSLDMSKWTRKGGGTFNVSGGQLSTVGEAAIYSTANLNDAVNKYIELRGKLHGASGNDVEVGFGTITSSGLWRGSRTGEWITAIGWDNKGITINDSVGTEDCLTYSAGALWDSTGYFTYRVKIDSNRARVWKNGTSIMDQTATCSYNISSAPVLVVLDHSPTAPNYTQYLDYIFVRKYASPEPTATIGNETAAGISKAGSYGIGANTTTAFASINNQTISGAISSGWNHIALTYDKDAGGTDEMKLYVNGIQSATGDYSTQISTNTNNLLIGDYFNGTIDEVRIYNRALSAEEIKAHFNFFRLLKVR